MKEKIPGKGWVLVGNVLLLIFGAIALFSALGQISSVNEILASGVLPDSAAGILRACLFIDPLRGVLALASAAMGFVYLKDAGKWINKSMIVAVIAAVVELVGIMLFVLLSNALGGNETVKYSLALLALVIQLVGYGNMKRAPKSSNTPAPPLQ